MRVRILAVLLLSVSLSNAFAQTRSAAPPSFESEAQRQSAIYQSLGTQVPEGYVVGRSLLSYAFMLPSEFRRSLAALDSSDRWLDIGAGEGRAIVDYCTSRYSALLRAAGNQGERATAIAMSIEDRRTHDWNRSTECVEQKRIQYLFGRRLHEYSSEELGRFDLITDVLGGFSYTRHVTDYMQRVLDLLNVNGTFYTVLQDVQFEDGRNRPYYAGSPFLTQLVDGGGADVKICTWLKSISCVEVTCEAKAESAPPAEMYGVRKTCEQTRVPPLALRHFAAGTPPERRFQVQLPTTAEAGGTQRAQ